MSPNCLWNASFATSCTTVPMSASEMSSWYVLSSFVTAARSSKNASYVAWPSALILSRCDDAKKSWYTSARGAMSPGWSASSMVPK